MRTRIYIIKLILRIAHLFIVSLHTLLNLFLFALYFTSYSTLIQFLFQLDFLVWLILLYRK